MRLPRFPTEYLYVQPSNLRTRYRGSREYNVTIGNGLFTSKRIPAGFVIAVFMGDVIPTDINDMAIESDPARDGYQVQLNEENILDCSDYKNYCLASIANDYRLCRDLETNRRAVQNAEIVCVNKHKKADDSWERYAFLKATKDIPAYTEIITYYGKKFKIVLMPPEVIDLSVEMDTSDEDANVDVIDLIGDDEDDLM